MPESCSSLTSGVVQDDGCFHVITPDSIMTYSFFRQDWTSTRHGIEAQRLNVINFEDKQLLLLSMHRKHLQTFQYDLVKHSLISKPHNLHQAISPYHVF